MADNSIKSFFKGQIPPELSTKIDGVLENFDSEGNLTVELDLSVNDDLTVSDNLTVGGDATITGNLSSAGVTSSLGLTVSSGSIAVTSGNLTLSSGDLAATGGFKQTVGPWSVTDMAAVGTATASVFGFSGGTFVAPTAGSVMAISASLSAAAAGSDATFQVFKNNALLSGTEVVLTDGGATSNIATFSKDAKAFAAGDKLDIRYITHASNWTSTTVDAVVTITVEF